MASKAAKAPAAAPELTRGGIATLRAGYKAVDGPASSSAAQRALRLQVIDVYRHLLYENFRETTGLDPGSRTCGYDVELSDGDFKYKCLLHPAFWNLAEEEVLQMSSIIDVQDAVLRYDETVIGGPAFVTITELTIVEAGSQFVARAKDGVIRFPPDAPPRVVNLVPVCGPREYYLHFDINDCPPPGWPLNDIAAPWDYVVPAENATLGAVARASSAWPEHPPLVGRIMSKERLHHFGKADETNKFPFQFTFLLADATHTLEVVVWNTACRTYYRALCIGDIVRISGYKIQRSFKRQGNVEISVNPVNPAGQIEILTEFQCADFPVPSLAMQFAPSEQMIQYPDRTVCDVVGVVLYVGRVEKELGVGDYKGYSIHRWLMLRDSADGKVLRLQMYICGQPDAFHSVAIGNVVAVTQVTTLRLIDDSSFVVLRTTQTSQLLVGGASMARIDGDAQVGKVIAWRENVDVDALADKEPTGHRIWMPKFDTADDYRAVFPKLPVALLTDIPQLAQDLLPTEHRRMMTQGRVAAIELLSQGDPAKKRKRGEASADEEESERAPKRGRGKAAARGGKAGRGGKNAKNAKSAKSAKSGKSGKGGKSKAATQESSESASSSSPPPTRNMRRALAKEEAFQKAPGKKAPAKKAAAKGKAAAAAKAKEDKDLKDKEDKENKSAKAKPARGKKGAKQGPPPVTPMKIVQGPQMSPGKLARFRPNPELLKKLLEERDRMMRGEDISVPPKESAEEAKRKKEEEVTAKAAKAAKVAKAANKAARASQASSQASAQGAGGEDRLGITIYQPGYSAASLSAIGRARTQADVYEPPCEQGVARGPTTPRVVWVVTLVNLNQTAAVDVVIVPQGSTGRAATAVGALEAVLPSEVVRAAISMGDGKKAPAGKKAAAAPAKSTSRTQISDEQLARNLAATLKDATLATVMDLYRPRNANVVECAASAMWVF